MGKLRGARFQDRHLKTGDRLEPLRFHPERDPIRAVRFQLKLLHDPPMPMRVGPEILQPNSRIARVHRLTISKTDHTRFVMEGIARKPVLMMILKPTVHPGYSRVRFKLRAPSAHTEQRTLNRDAFGQMPVVREHSPAVAHGKEARDQLQ